jgi:hypothetical protein
VLSVIVLLSFPPFPCCCCHLVLPSLLLSCSPPSCCSSLPVVISSLLPCPVITNLYGPGAPAFHLTSSGSSEWVWVLHCSLLLLLFFSSHPGHCYLLLVLALWSWSSFPHHPFPHPQFHTHNPPLKQALAGLGWGGVLFVTMGCCGGALGSFLSLALFWEGLGGSV